MGILVSLMKNKVIIIRACSNAGKSSFAAYLQSLVPGAVICSADNFFMKDGKYVFDAKLLGDAHTKCQCDFYDALEAETPLVIVDNTNVTENDMAKYIELAKDFNYEIISLVVENRHGNKNIHNVPEASLDKQESRLRANLKLR